MKTLIIYSTKHGSAKDCVEKLSKKLDGDVQITNLKTSVPPGLAAFDNIIIGGSVYMGKIQKEVSEYCNKNIEALKSKKIGLFIVCMMVGDKACEQIINSFPIDLYKNAVIKSIFGGEFRFDKLGFLEKMAVKIVSKAEKNSPAIDMKANHSTISDEEIEAFALAMNEIRE